MVPWMRNRLYVRPWWALLLALGACQSAPKTAESAPTTTALFFPTPPTPPRVQYLTWYTGAEQIEPTRSSFDSFVLGEKPVAKPRMNKPFGVASRDGVIYVCDTKDVCIARFDLKSKAYSVFGNSGPGELKKPINIVIDQLGFKFVADPIRNQVVVFGPDDKFVAAHEVPKPSRIVNVAAYQNELFVVDNDETCQIAVLDRSSGKLLRSFGSRGTGPGQFVDPAGIAVSRDGFVYVTDAVACRVHKFTRDGQLVWSKGEPGYHLGQFGRPRGIAVGPDGVLYITDAATELVQMFNADGEVLMHFGGPGNEPGAMYLPATVAVDTTSMPYFKSLVHKDFKADYLLLVANQYGPNLITVYAFGAFPEGYHFNESEFRTIPIIPPESTTDPGTESAPTEKVVPKEGADGTGR